MAYERGNNNPGYGPRSMYNSPASGTQYHQSSALSFPYAQQAQGPEGQMNNGPRQHYLPNQNSGIGVPDDPFKKPPLPPKVHHGPPSSFSYPPHSTASSAATTAAFPAQGPSQQAPNLNHSYQATSSMTASVPPATSSAQSTPTSEAPSQATDTAPQVNRLSPLDQERVDALLNVNNLLLQEVHVLQKSGLKALQAGNPQSPQQANPANASSPQTKADGPSTSPTPSESPAPAAAAAAGTNPANSTSSTPTTTTPTLTVQQQAYIQKKFVEYMKRLQTNIMFLVSMSDATKQRQRAPYPSHLEPLPNWLAEGTKEEERSQFEALKEGYSKLRELWPDWKPGAPGSNPQQQQAQAQAQNRQQQASTQPMQQPQAQSNIAGKV